MSQTYSHQDYQRCLELYEAGQTQIIYSELLADTQTAVAAMMKLSTDTDHACLLESVEGGEVRGRFSVIAIVIMIVILIFNLNFMPFPAK